MEKIEIIEINLDDENYNTNKNKKHSFIVIGTIPNKNPLKRYTKYLCENCGLSWNHFYQIGPFNLEMRNKGISEICRKK